MRGAGSAGRDEGLRLSRELLEALLRRIDGAYFMPSFGRYELVATLVREIRARVGRRGGALPACADAHPAGVPSPRCPSVDAASRCD